MIKNETFVSIICGLICLKVICLCYEDFVVFVADNAYQTECIMHDPPTPVEYESRYNDGAVYVITYEGHFRWNGEKCTERKSVDVKEYRRAKLIVGEQDGR